MGILENFNIWVDKLSDGKGYMLMGLIMNDKNVIFYLPFEPTIKDFLTILRNFRKVYSITDDFNFQILIQPLRYDKRMIKRRTSLCI